VRGELELTRSASPRVDAQLRADAAGTKTVANTRGTTSRARRRHGVSRSGESLAAEVGSPRARDTSRRRQEHEREGQGRWRLTAPDGIAASKGPACHVQTWTPSEAASPPNSTNNRASHNLNSSAYGRERKRDTTIAYPRSWNVFLHILHLESDALLSRALRAVLRSLRRPAGKGQLQPGSRLSGSGVTVL
jgi:hypothetical protein